MIADDRQVESLAGIMGGDATAVSDDTRNVYVEAAFWWPQAVQGRSRRYNFSTDAGHRFERGVDPSLTVEHIEHITRLILEICGGEAGPMDDQVLALPEGKPVAMRVARAAKVIGMPISREQCLDAFRRLGLPAQARGRHDRGHAAAVPLRPGDRGGPGRGSGAHRRLRAPAHHAAAGAGHAPACGRKAAARVSPCAARWRRWATRKRSTSVSSRSAGRRTSPATPTRSGCSTRSPAR